MYNILIYDHTEFQNGIASHYNLLQNISRNFLFYLQIINKGGSDIRGVRHQKASDIRGSDIKNIQCTENYEIEFISWKFMN